MLLLLAMLAWASTGRGSGDDKVQHGPVGRVGDSCLPSNEYLNHKDILEVQV